MSVLIGQMFEFHCEGKENMKTNIVSLSVVRQRQEEKRQQEESSKVKERKRKREKYAEKVWN